MSELRAGSTIACPICSHENAEGELFCAGCQQRLPRPSTDAFGAMYREQEASRRGRSRRDVIYGLVWGGVMGLLTLWLALSLEAEGGDRWIATLGKQLWWLVGLLWGLGVWFFRRMSSAGR